MIFGLRKLFGFHDVENCIELFHNKLCPISAIIQSGILKGKIQLLMKAAVTSPEVSYRIRIARVNFLYWFVIITTWVLSFFVFGNDPSMSMVASCSGPLERNSRSLCR